MALQSKYTGPVFIHQFELLPTPAQARQLRIRMEIACQFYNAMLGEAHRRYKACRRDARWAEAVALLKAGEKTKATALFGAIEKQHGSSEFGMNDVASSYRCHVFREHLDSQTCYDLAKRAFRACTTFYADKRHTPGKRRRIRFCRPGHFHTIASQTIKVDPDKHAITWWRMSMPYRLDAKDADGLQAYVLDILNDPDNIRRYGRRITRKMIRGEARYYVQVTLKGQPFQKAKHPVQPGSVGIDLGPSAVAIVTGATISGLAGALHQLAPDCQRDEAKVRRLQRYLDRSRRATNPDCYDEQGRCIAKPRHQSKRYRLAALRLAETERKLQERRKRAHNALVHAILRRGLTVKAEDLSYAGWQRGRYGKSVGKRAPGQFLARLKQQAETAGGTFTAIDTKATRFSQFCHGCGTYTKKPLSLRVHHCEVCGLGPV
jgi:transposase